MTKRLFLFASYDKDKIIDPTLLHYLRALSKLGDIIFTMDNDTPKSEMDKLSDVPNILHATAVRHNEYDFGSYKRGYAWAHDNKILDKYDWVYLVNDSVYGPFYDLEPVLNNLESRNVDMVGMCSSEINRFPVHIQSWFVGLSNKVATSEFFKNFILNVKHQESKSLIVLKYEVRMTRLVIEHGYNMSVIYNDKDAVIYRTPNPVLNAGVPFVKKATMTQVYDIEFLNPYTTEEFVSEIISYAIRHYNVPYTHTHTSYKKIYKFSLVGIPLFGICVQYAHWGNSYKGLLFDKIPIIKIIRNKIKQEE